jgi:hypothetical protein
MRQSVSKRSKMMTNPTICPAEPWWCSMWAAEWRAKPLTVKRVSLAL